MRIKPARWAGWGGISCILAAAVLSGWPRFSFLEIHPAESPDKILFRSPMKSGEAFVLSFTHSVNKRPVYDTLRVEGDHLVIVKSRFDAFGAGMPETTTGDGELSVGKDGWMEWKVNRPVPEITVRVGRIADHILDIRGKQIHLSDLARGGSALTFRVRYGYFLDMLKGRCMT